MADKKISQLTNASTPLTGVEVLPVVQSSATVKVSVNNLTVGRNVETAELTAVKTSAGALIDALVVRNESTTANAETGIFFEPTANIGKIRGARISAINDGANVVGLKFYTGAGAAITSKLEIEGAATGNVTFATGNLIQGTAAKGINFTANTPAAGMTSQLLNWYEEGTWTPTMTSAAGTTTVNTSSARYTRVGDHVFVVFRIDYTTNGSVGTSDFTIGGLPFTSRGTFNSRGFVNSSNWTGSDYNDGYITIGAAVTTLVWAGRAVNQSSRTNAVLLFSADYFV